MKPPICQLVDPGGLRVNSPIRRCRIGGELFGLSSNLASANRAFLIPDVRSLQMYTDEFPC